MQNDLNKAFEDATKAFAELGEVLRNLDISFIEQETLAAECFLNSSLSN